jgi:DNA-binding beta-propeller fold protein YncE
MEMSKLVRGMSVCACVLLVAACSTPQKAERMTAFYPSPEEPRLQYLTSYSAPEDLAAVERGFSSFILGTQPASGPPIIKPYGMAVHGSKLFVCDTMTAMIHVLDFADPTWEYFQPEFQEAFKKPLNLAIDAAGMRYVVDTLRGEVAVYDTEEILQYSLGREQGIRPVGVAVTEERVYITDLNHRVCVFDKATRKLEFTVPRNPDNEQERLFSPTNVAVDDENNIYVSDTGGYRVQKYAPDGTYLLTIGSHGDRPGQFARNKGIAVDRNGVLYVVDAASQTVQMFDAEGRLLLWFGEPGASPFPLVLPAAVAIDYNNVELFRDYIAEDFAVEYLVYVTSQYGSRKVNVYAFGRKKEQ